jgi:hypothetical protein
MHDGGAMLNWARSLHLLREDQIPPAVSRPSYENEGSERVSRGSVTLPSGGRWSASLEVRMGDDQGALLTMNRAGAGAGPAPSDASLMIPPDEADVLLLLLKGLIEQARADGVLAPRPAVSPRSPRPRTGSPGAPGSGG